MELRKGTIIKLTKENKNPIFKDTTANGVLIYEVTKVNKNTYSLKCIEGYMKNTECKLSKNFKPVMVDSYGTTTTWEVAEDVVTKKEAIAEAKATYHADCLENGWTLKQWIEDHIQSLKEDGYKVI